MAPEVQGAAGYGLEADLWAAGCLFYAMVTGGAPPFQGRRVGDTLANARTGRYAVPEGLSDAAKDFLACLLSKVLRSRLVPLPRVCLALCFFVNLRCWRRGRTGGIGSVRGGTGQQGWAGSDGKATILLECVSVSVAFRLQSNSASVPWMVFRSGYCSLPLARSVRSDRTKTKKTKDRRREKVNTVWHSRHPRNLLESIPSSPLANPNVDAR